MLWLTFIKVSIIQFHLHVTKKWKACYYIRIPFMEAIPYSKKKLNCQCNVFIDNIAIPWILHGFFFFKINLFKRAQSFILCSKFFFLTCNDILLEFWSSDANLDTYGTVASKSSIWFIFSDRKLQTCSFKLPSELML